MGWKKVFAMDSGSYTIKAGFSEAENCNSVVEPEETCLIFTEPHCNFPSIRDATLETLFETYGFAAVATFYPTALSALNHCLKASTTVSTTENDNSFSNQCVLVVDIGHSATYVAPYIGGRMYQKGLKRLDLGGKALTNQLKEVISYRQLQVMDETYVINQCREDCCYVSQDFDADMHTVQTGDPGRKIVCDYVLPDFVERSRGFIVNDENKKSAADFQKVRLGVETFSIPELLFRPADVGLHQMGAAELAAFCVQNLCPRENCYCVPFGRVDNGKLYLGEMMCESELRSFAASHYNVTVYHDQKECDLQAWKGAKSLAMEHNSHMLKSAAFERAAYLENGHKPLGRGYVVGDED